MSRLQSSEYLYKELLERVNKGDSLYDVLNWNPKLDIIKMYDVLGCKDSITVINHLLNMGECVFEDSDINDMLDTFPSFDTSENMLHLHEFITDNNYDRIYGKYSTYESLSQYLPHTSSYHQQQSLLRHVEKIKQL